MGRGASVRLTSKTGAGKTTTATALQVALARGVPFAGRETTMGAVLALAGENPDDYSMHLMATLQDQGLGVHGIAGPLPRASCSWCLAPSRSTTASSTCASESRPSAPS